MFISINVHCYQIKWRSDRGKVWGSFFWSDGPTGAKSGEVFFGRTVGRLDSRTVGRLDSRTVGRSDGRTVRRSDGRTVGRWTADGRKFLLRFRDEGPLCKLALKCKNLYRIGPRSEVGE